MAGFFVCLLSRLSAPGTFCFEVFYIIFIICFFGRTPTAEFVILPFFMTTSSGMLDTPNKAARSPSSSTFTLQTFILSLFSSAISEIVGESIRHGPHQLAQKSIRTGLSDLRTSCSKLFLVMFNSAIFVSIVVFLVNYILDNG